MSYSFVCLGYWIHQQPVKSRCVCVYVLLPWHTAGHLVICLCCISLQPAINTQDVHAWACSEYPLSTLSCINVPKWYDLQFDVQCTLSTSSLMQLGFHQSNGWWHYSLRVRRSKGGTKLTVSQLTVANLRNCGCRADLLASCWLDSQISFSLVLFLSCFVFSPLV